MSDGDDVTREGLFALLGREVRIESRDYPREPAVGTLDWVGPDPFIGAVCAHVNVRLGTTRFVPLDHVVHYAEVR